MHTCHLWRECMGRRGPGVSPCAVAHRRSPRWSPTGDALDLPHSSGLLQSLLVRCPRSPSDAIAQILSDASPPSRNRDSAKCVSSTPHSSRSPSGQTNGPIPRAGRPHGQDPMPRDRTLMVSMRPTRALRGWHLAPQPTHSGDSRSSARRNAMWPCARPSSRRSRSHRRCACG